MNPYREIGACRVSGSPHLVSVLHLGIQTLTGVFPKNPADKITKGPLELAWCPDSGLLQLRHSYNPSEMYGENYGYRSGLNASMVRHLSETVQTLEQRVVLNPTDVVLDIGSNDATLLKQYARDVRRIGIDPTGNKFRQYYPEGITLIPEFFSAEAYRAVEKRSARMVTSLAMFYDLETPVEFARQIASILADDGLWHFEQSYMPAMLRLNSYDTICHEHLEYYSLGVVQKIMDQAGFKIVDVAMNGINGGSFAVTAAKRDNTTVSVNHPVIHWLLEQEERMGLHTPCPYRRFEERVFRHRDDLVRLVRALRADGKKILGYGASTKGNVVLQFCGLTASDLSAMMEVNPDKFGCFTPGTSIPIVSEKEALAMQPDYLLVLPWHFKEEIMRRERDYLARGGHLIFPFPEIEIV